MIHGALGSTLKERGLSSKVGIDTTTYIDGPSEFYVGIPKQAINTPSA
ncbi:hypothetical protein [Legionella sp. W05-934-2]